MHPSKDNTHSYSGTLLYPWQPLSSDLFYFDSHHWLLVVDQFSHFPIARKLNDQSGTTIAEIFNVIIGEFGVPAEILTDNGPCYTAEPFQTLCKRYHILHYTSSPTHAQSNGFAECYVRIIKSILSKVRESGQDMNQALLGYRTTPLDSNTPSPMELLFGRTPRSDLPNVDSNMKPTNLIQIQLYNDTWKCSVNRCTGTMTINGRRQKCSRRVKMFSLDPGWISTGPRHK